MMAVAAPSKPVLAARAVSRSFGAVEVLHGVSLEFHAGRVHALIGENGAGKSTLMKILSGYLPPSSGSLEVDGAPIRFAGPADAERHGIVLVHQEILLAPDLTVAQNIFLGREIAGRFGLDDGAMNRMAADAVRDLGGELAPDVRVERLSIAQRQLVQIARALRVPHRVAIFDEPTAPLTPVEAEALFRTIAILKAKGVAVVYISHRLPEVKAIADEVSVLRDGDKVATRAAADLDVIEMARLMVGRDLARLYPMKRLRPDEPIVLRADRISSPGHVRAASFDLKQGEILGFAGLIGAGRTELFEALVGLRPAAGAVEAAGARGPFRTCRAAMNAGLVYVSEDRKGKGLLLSQRPRFNLTLASLSEFVGRFGVDLGRENRALEAAVERFDIRGARDIAAGQLSGGNQQKLLFAKMMQLDPRIVVFDEPTRGVDIGAKQQIYAFIAEFAAQGKAVVVISSEMQELIGLCHRVMVMREGEIAGELSGQAIAEEEIVVLATGARPAAALGATP